MSLTPEQRERWKRERINDGNVLGAKWTFPRGVRDEIELRIAVADHLAEVEAALEAERVKVTRLREVVEYILEVARRDGVYRPAQLPGERLCAIDEICVAALNGVEVP